MDNGAKITLVGAGTIGLSFAALHLSHLKDASYLTIYDTRPDLSDYIKTTLPKYLDASKHDSISGIRIANDLASAVRDANIVQEQGPENLPFKKMIWKEIEQHAPKDALLWSSTSGIPASAQSVDMHDPSRLIVVHPYNPPHIMPLLEVVPSPATSQDVLDRTVSFCRALEREPVVLKKECTGFVANRLAFALLREAIHLVHEGVVGVEELDTIVQSSMGPRWAVAGPFKSYHAGGGAGGLEGFFQNIGGTVQGCWDELGDIKYPDGQWEPKVFKGAADTYGVVDTEARDSATKRVLAAVKAKEM